MRQQSAQNSVSMTGRHFLQLRSRRFINKNERGVALVLVLLLLSMMSALGVGMVLSIGSDMMINGYYRNYRGSFYAADSGMNIARQALVNKVMLDLPPTIAVDTSPMPANEDTTVQNLILANYGAGNTSLNAGQGAGSWGGSYDITGATFACIDGCAARDVTATDVNGKAIGFRYIFNYTLSSVGKAQGTEQTTVSENGSVTINATLTPAAGNNFNFAGYGMFIDQQTICNGSYLVPGTISGPVFTNGGWTFGTTGAYIFTDQVGQVNPNAGFQFSGTCEQKPASQDTVAPQTIKPTFQTGFGRGQAAVPLPPNDFSQERAVLDGLGTNTAGVTHSDLNNANTGVKDINGTAYPIGGAASGVYLPYTISGPPPVSTINGGGIYVEGNASVTLTAGTSGAGNPAQIFAITQGGTTTTVTIDLTTLTTKVVSGGTTLNLAGVPWNRNANPSPTLASAATMLYVNGSITALKGPAQGVAAIQDQAAVTVTAKNDVTITGDILYKTEPVTLTQNQMPCCNNTPADTLIPGYNTMNQTLGIFTSTGNINLANAQANKNLEIDASLATISTGGTGGLQNTGAAINTLNIVGGRIQNQIKNINSTTRNVFFDRRYAARPGFSPPWFPSTVIVPPGIDTTAFTSSVQRTQWVTTPQ